MKLKVCGMRSAENIALLSNLSPDYMGFIFWKPSKRYVDKDTPVLPQNIKKTGVFVNDTEEYIMDTIERHQLQAVQLHGEEHPSFCNKIRSTGIETIKAFAVDSNFDFSVLEPYENNCDYYLFDTKGDLPGGNGRRFDWSLLKDYPSGKPFFLSGGIGPGDQSAIASIISLNLPLYAVDINSQFEVAPAIKDIEKIKAFKAIL